MTGFTLVEMLVAISIVALLSLFLASVVGQATQLWISAENQSDYRLRARAALDYIGRDLKLAMLSPDNQSLEFIVNPPNMDSAYQCRDSIFWQAPVASNSSLGKVAEIGYFVQWDMTGTVPHANLCRFEVDPTDVTNYAIYTQSGWSSSPGGWVTKANLLAVAPATQASAYKGLFLENVVGLWIQGYNSDAANTLYSGDSYATSPPTLPATLEIALVVLNKSTAARLTSVQASTIKNLYSSVQTVTTISGACAQATAAAFVTSLPPALQSGANVISIKVPMNRNSP